MHGMIFIAIQQHLRNLHEDQLLRECFPLPGQYIAMGDYPADDLVAIARKIARRRSFASQRPVEEALRMLGEAVPAVASRMAPNLMPRASTFLDLLGQLQNGAPVQGRTLLPNVQGRRRPDGLFTLLDLGPPELCRFGEGLLVGHATLLGDSVAFRHPTCRGREESECLFVVRFLRNETTTKDARPSGETSGPARSSPKPRGG